MRQQALYKQHRTGHIALGQRNPRPTGRRAVLCSVINRHRYGRARSKAAGEFAG